MRIKSFTLIELIIVVIILSIVSYFVLTSIKSATQNLAITPDKLRDTFSPNGVLYLFRDENKSIRITNPIVYDKDLNIIHFERYKDKEVLFRYIVKDGIQNSYILQCNEGIYVFKPLWTIKVDSLQKAKELLSLDRYMPTDGDYYK